MRDVILYLMLAAIIGGTIALQHLRLNAAEERAARLDAEALELRAEVARWQVTYAQARAGQEALTAQAQSCLDRETAARADADQWRQIFKDMTLRNLDAEEAQGVPDDATRRALLSALDRPL